MELIGGIEKRDIFLVPYNNTWPQIFMEQRNRIYHALGDQALRIDHIGSTSVPGLAAKPIIDINVSVKDVAAEDTYLPALSDARYMLRVREDMHRMLRTPELDVHVHICQTHSDWERRHLLFRDYLRFSATDRHTYQEVKYLLTQQSWPDMNDYARAKSDIIAQITKRAELWAAHTNWTYTHDE